MRTTRKTLERAAEILQDAHDEIEVYGFDISTYAGDYFDGGETNGPRCYIGSVRAAAGVNPDPVIEGVLAHEGDGQELEIALSALDRAARGSSLIKEAKRKTKAFFGVYGDNAEVDLEHEIEQQPGRLIENLGFAYKVDDRDEDEQKYIALAFFRKAITQVQEKLA